MDIGVIGAGIMGRNHARIYSELKNVDSLYIYDIDQNAARDVAEKLDATACSSIDQLLKQVDGVSICVPTSYHLEVSKKAIENEIPCLIEKPLCSNLEECEELIKHTPEDLVVGVGHIERFNPIVDEIKNIISKPIYVEFKRHNPDSTRINDVSVIEDLMIHDIDIMRNVLFSGPYGLHAFGNEKLCGANFTFNSSYVYLSASMKSSKKIRTIYIEEEGFTVEGDFINQEIYVHRKPGQYHIEDERYVQENIVEKVLVNKKEPLKLELSTFIDCIKNDIEFPVTLQQAYSNMEICYMMKKECGMC